MGRYDPERPWLTITRGLSFRVLCRSCNRQIFFTYGFTENLLVNDLCGREDPRGDNYYQCTNPACRRPFLFRDIKQFVLYKWYYDVKKFSHCD